MNQYALRWQTASLSPRSNRSLGRKLALAVVYVALAPTVAHAACTQLDSYTSTVVDGTGDNDTVEITASFSTARSTFYSWAPNANGAKLVLNDFLDTNPYDFDFLSSVYDPSAKVGWKFGGKWTYADKSVPGSRTKLKMSAKTSEAIPTNVDVTLTLSAILPPGTLSHVTAAYADIYPDGLDGECFEVGSYSCRSLSYRGGHLIECQH